MAYRDPPGPSSHVDHSDGGGGGGAPGPYDDFGTGAGAGVTRSGARAARQGWNAAPSRVAMGVAADAASVSARRKARAAALERLWRFNSEAAKSGAVSVVLLMGSAAAAGGLPAAVARRLRHTADRDAAMRNAKRAAAAGPGDPDDDADGGDDGSDGGSGGGGGGGGGDRDVPPGGVNATRGDAWNGAADDANGADEAEVALTAKVVSELPSGESTAVWVAHLGSRELVLDGIVERAPVSALRDDDDGDDTSAVAAPAAAPGDATDTGHGTAMMARDDGVGATSGSGDDAADADDASDEWATTGPPLAVDPVGRHPAMHHVLEHAQAILSGTSLSRVFVLVDGDTRALRGANQAALWRLVARITVAGMELSRVWPKSGLARSRTTHLKPRTLMCLLTPTARAAAIAVAALTHAERAATSADAVREIVKRGDEGPPDRRHFYGDTRRGGSEVFEGAAGAGVWSRADGAETSDGAHAAKRERLDYSVHANEADDDIGGGMTWTSEWACPVCTLHNTEAATKCVVCETKRPAAAAGNAGTARWPGSPWQCPACKCRNAQRQARCAVCNHPHGSSAADDPSSASEGTTDAGAGAGAGAGASSGAGRSAGTDAASKPAPSTSVVAHLAAEHKAHMRAEAATEPDTALHVTHSSGIDVSAAVASLAAEAGHGAAAAAAGAVVVANAGPVLTGDAATVLRGIEWVRVRRGDTAFALVVVPPTTEARLILRGYEDVGHPTFTDASRAAASFRAALRAVRDLATEDCAGVAVIVTDATPLTRGGEVCEEEGGTLLVPDSHAARDAEALWRAALMVGALPHGGGGCDGSGGASAAEEAVLSSTPEAGTGMHVISTNGDDSAIAAVAALVSEVHALGGIAGAPDDAPAADATAAGGRGGGGARAVSAWDLLAAAAEGASASVET